MTRSSPARQALFLGLAVLTVFGLALWAPFIYDDTSFMIKNPDVTGPWPGVMQWLASPLINTTEYEPLGILVHRFLYALGGERVFVYRLSSLLLHWANAVLVLLLYRRLLGEKSLYFWAALLFALFPAHTEVLAISTFKKHLLVAFFGLLMLHLQERRSWPEPLRLACCWSALGLAMLAKESALILPALGAAVSIAASADWRRRLKEDALLYAGFGFMCLALVAWRTFGIPRTLTHLPGGTLTTHLLTSGKCLLWYLRELFLPVGLCQEHTLAPAGELLAPASLAIAGGLAALIALGVSLWRRDRLLGLSLAWCVVTLAPFLNLVPYLNLSLVANRYLYLAAAGFFLGAARLAGRIPPIRLTPRLALVPLSACALALFYGGVAMAHLGRYSDTLDLWSHTVRCAPGHARGHMILGDAYRERLRFDEAASEYRKAIRLFRPYVYTDAHAALASVYAQTGRPREAAKIMAAICHGRPFPANFSAAGVFWAMAGENGKALAAFEQALRLAPHDGSALLNIGVHRFEAGRLDLAEGFAGEAAGVPETRPEGWGLLGKIYEKQGRKAKARAAFEASLALNPLQADLIGRLARLYAEGGQAPKGAVLYDRLVAALEERLAILRASNRSAQDAGIEYATALSLQAARLERKAFLAPAANHNLNTTRPHNIHRRKATLSATQPGG